MPTTRRRRTRTRAKLPPLIEHLFLFGCGAAKYSESEARALWKEHGRKFLNSIPAEKAARGGFAGNPFFLKCYGPPEDIEVNRASE